MTDEDRVRIGKRYDAEITNAAAWLRAEDIEDAQERARRGRIRAALVFIEGYRELPLLAWPREVLDSIVALEQSFTIFRQRHARMVERVIGRRTGTGGSAGVDYLDMTALRYRVFRDVWATRTLLIRRDALPTLDNGRALRIRGGGELSAKVVVVGGGTMGIASAWSLARRGHQVTVLERFEHRHEYGSHGGFTRIIRQAYHEGSDYVRVVRAADRLWTELEERCGEQLLVRCGLLEFGPPDDPEFVAAVRSLEAHGIAHERLRGPEAP